MPAMVRWPGKIAAGTVNTELVATYDIFPTMLSLAGVAPPLNRVIDGIDLTPLLIGSSGEPHGHGCLFHYHSGVDLAAVRCGAHKLYFNGSAPTRASPPSGLVLYDIESDPGEHNPVPDGTDSWHATVATIVAARDAHLATVVKVQDQVNLGTDIQ